MAGHSFRNSILLMPRQERVTHVKNESRIAPPQPVLICSEGGFCIQPGATSGGGELHGQRHRTERATDKTPCQPFHPLVIRHLCETLSVNEGVPPSASSIPRENKES